MTGNPRADGSTPSPEQLREQVEATREQLAVTVEALAAKADVKGRAQDKAAEVKSQVRDKADHASRAARRNRGPLISVGATAAALAVIVLVRRSRRC